MTIQEILARIAEINSRCAQIEIECRAQGVSAEKMKELSDETEKLVDERKSLQQQVITARTKANGANYSNIIEDPSSATPSDDGVDFKSMSKRDKIAYIVGKQARGKSFSDVEKRALGSAVTTTSVIFTEASEAVDGVNNAGVFIKTEIMLDLLREEGAITAILDDIAFTHVKGMTEFPYRKKRTKASTRKEKEDTADGQMEWDSVKGTKGYLQSVIRVTDEVLALSDASFGSYIIDQLMQDMTEDWSENLIYGNGTDNVTGVTVGAIEAVTNGYSGDPTKAIIAGIKLCPAEYRRGATIYVAQDVYDDVYFAVDDNGNFKFPVINNMSGIQNLGQMRIKVDETLKAGDFVIGNVAKFYKANMLSELGVEKDRLARKHINDYVASVYCAAAPVPGAFVYGKKKASASS